MKTKFNRPNNCSENEWNEEKGICFKLGKLTFVKRNENGNKCNIPDDCISRTCIKGVCCNKQSNNMCSDCSSGTCQSCKPGYEINKGTNICNQKKISVENCKGKLSSYENCKECSIDSKCGLCKSGFILNKEKKCVKKPNGYECSNKTECSSGICKKRCCKSEDSNCEECDGEGGCLTCKSGLFKNSDGLCTKKQPGQQCINDDDCSTNSCMGGFCCRDDVTNCNSCLENSGACKTCNLNYDSVHNYTQKQNHYCKSNWSNDYSKHIDHSNVEQCKKLCSQDTYCKGFVFRPTQYNKRTSNKCSTKFTKAECEQHPNYKGVYGSNIPSDNPSRTWKPNRAAHGCITYNNVVYWNENQSGKDCGTVELDCLCKNEGECVKCTGQSLEWTEDKENQGYIKDYSSNVCTLNQKGSGEYCSNNNECSSGICSNPEQKISNWGFSRTCCKNSEEYSNCQWCNDTGRSYPGNCGICKRGYDFDRSD